VSGVPAVPGPMGGSTIDVARMLVATLRERRAHLGRLAAWSLLEALPAFFSGRLVATALDDGFLAGRPAAGLGWLGVFAGAVLVGAWGTRQTFLRLAALVEPFRDELVRLTVAGALRRAAVAGRPVGAEGVARLTQQVEVVREAYGSLLVVTQAFVVTTTSALLGLLTLIPIVLAFVLPPLLLGVGLFLGSLAAMAARQRAAIRADERFAEAAGALAGELRDVVACGGEASVCADVGRRVDAAAQAAKALARLTAVRTLAIGVGGWSPVLLVLAAAPWLVQRGATAGAILGALTYLSQQLYPALQALVRAVGHSGLLLVVTLGRIVETAAEPAAAPGVSSGLVGIVRSRPRGYEIELRRVIFGYGRRAEPVVRDLDLAVPEGDHLAIVGPSGVGKSTLTGLLAGMLHPQCGAVLLGGVSIDALDAGTLARHRVLIPQEAYVFAGTLWENLAYLRPHATPAQVDAAVDAVGLDQLATRLGGYDAPVAPAALSAGERQLVALARAYLSPAPVVVLDEATCHLDPATEARAERAFVTRPGSLVVVAHRVSSALRARRILLMDAGDVTLGSHESLLSASLLYRDLVGRWDAA
jgi:ABC-type multidrug transport system fused ATPase/permease subunit